MQILNSSATSGKKINNKKYSKAEKVAKQIPSDRKVVGSNPCKKKLPLADPPRRHTAR